MVMMMVKWWEKMVLPVRCVWSTVYSRVKPSSRSGNGLLKLCEDVETCGYEDVQVMWEMIKRSESSFSHGSKRKQHRPFWRNFLWSNQNKTKPATGNTST